MYRRVLSVVAHLGLKSLSLIFHHHQHRVAGKRGAWFFFVAVSRNNIEHFSSWKVRVFRHTIPFNFFIHVWVCVREEVGHHQHAGVSRTTNTVSVGNAAMRSFSLTASHGLQGNCALM
jgi:hypothetical protein